MLERHFAAQAILGETTSASSFCCRSLAVSRVHQFANSCCDESSPSFSRCKTRSSILKPLSFIRRIRVDRNRMVVDSAQQILQPLELWHDQFVRVCLKCWLQYFQCVAKFFRRNSKTMKLFQVCNVDGTLTEKYRPGRLPTCRVAHVENCGWIADVITIQRIQQLATLLTIRFSLSQQVMDRDNRFLGFSAAFFQSFQQFAVRVTGSACTLFESSHRSRGHCRRSAAIYSFVWQLVRHVLPAGIHEIRPAPPATAG